MTSQMGAFPKLSVSYENVDIFHILGESAEHIETIPSEERLERWIGFNMRVLKETMDRRQQDSHTWKKMQKECGE